MAVDAPLREQETAASVERDPVEALIEEARERARRRRRLYGAVTIVVAITAVAAIVAFDGAGPLRGQGSTLDAGVRAPAAAIAADDEATLVAAWGRSHWGWVLVYGDRRVLVYVDIQAPLPDGEHRYSILERYLSPAGLDRVRSGTVTASMLLQPDQVPADVWSDLEFTVYAPSAHAACAHRDEWAVDTTTALRQLPAPVQELLRGTQRTYTDISPVDRNETRSPNECFTLSPEHARTVVQTADHFHVNRATALAELARSSGVDVAFKAADGTVIGLHITPVMPNGQGVLWGG